MFNFKKKLLPIISFIFGVAVAGFAWTSVSAVKASAEADEPKSVSLAEFQYFNEYSEDSQNIAMGQGKFGMLLRFDDVLSDNISEVNGGIKSLNLVGKYGKNILVNDMPIDFYTDAEIRYFFEEYLWVYIPHMDFYRKLSIETAFQFEDRVLQPFALYTASTPEGYNYWTDDAELYLTTKTQEVEFKKIEFNNTGYKYFSPKKGLLLEFDVKNGDTWMNADLSKTVSERDGSWMKMNLLNHSATKNALLGEGASVAENILLDGIPLKDIPDAEISYHSQRYLWVYAPNMIDYTTFEINDNTLFFDSFLPNVVLYSNGDEWIETDPNAPREDVVNVSFENIEWNNFDFGYRGGKHGLLVKFSDNLSKSYREIDGSIRSINKVNTSIGEHVRLNGEPLKNIAGAEISYHSEQYLWVYIPSEKLILADGYPCLTIDKDTEFLNAKFDEMTLYFDGCYWQETKPEATDYATNEFVEIMHNNVTNTGNEGYAITVFTFADDFDAELASRPNFAQMGEAGRTVTVNGKTLSELYAIDSNTNFVFNNDYGDNTMCLVLRKADLYSASGEPTVLTIADGTRFMDKTIGELTFYLVDGEWSETSAPSQTPAEDKDAPYLYYYGEESYLVFTGERVMDFTALTYAFDDCDGETACVVEMPEDAETDGKWNSGTWQVKLTSADTQGNTAEKEITVTVIDKEKEFLSVYVNGFFSYRVRYGEKIDFAKSEELLRGNPEKADSASSYFVFTGWQCNEKVWDFNNDVVTEDIELVPMYKECKRLFSVVIKDSNGDAMDFITAKYGDEIDFTEYEKEGYTLIVKANGTRVNSVTVNNNLSVELQYLPMQAENDGCQSGINWCGMALWMAVGVIFYAKLGKKAGREE
ncbi:MAG: hypothetical protein E7371_05165 [Clostridiales bacterium]|nr:hypothetical protein [Clostridiales bacterium]